MDFNDIIGHEQVISHLQNAISNNQIAHGYLFEGPKAIGKGKVAMVLAKTLLCKAGGTSPCGECSSCLKFDSFNHPDLHIESTEEASFKKQQVENIQKDIRTRPYEGKRKVFILEDADKMTQQAQNSFLKTLEEPPEYAVLIMTCTNRYSMLSTIVSRTQPVTFSPVANHLIEASLVKNYDKTPEEARFIAAFSSGIVGKAYSICESDDFHQVRAGLIEALDQLMDREPFKVFTVSEFFDGHKDKIDDLLDMTLIWFRDILLYKATNKPEYLINKDQLEALANQSERLSEDKVHDIIDVIKTTKKNIASKVNYQLSIEVMLLKIQEV